MTQQTSTETATTLPLKHPYTAASGVHVSCVTWRRLKVRDLKQASRVAKDGVDYESACIAAMVNMVPDDLDDMDAEDYAPLQARFRRLQGVD